MSESRERERIEQKCWRRTYDKALAKTSASHNSKLSLKLLSHNLHVVSNNESRVISLRKFSELGRYIRPLKRAGVISGIINYVLVQV